MVISKCFYKIFSIFYYHNAQQISYRRKSFIKNFLWISIQLLPITPDLLQSQTKQQDKQTVWADLKNSVRRFYLQNIQQNLLRRTPLETSNSVLHRKKNVIGLFELSILKKFFEILIWLSNTTLCRIKCSDWLYLRFICVEKY